MTNYLIMRGNTPEHYFFKPYEGICVRKRTPAGIWQEHTQIFADARDGFGFYCTRDKAVHLICTDRDNRLIYISGDGENRKKYVISSLNSDIQISDMKLYSVRGRLNLLYSALYNSENLLVHCILGDRAKPSTVDITETQDFSVTGGRVYYTNSRGVLGFVSLADEKPSAFSPVYEDAHCGSAYDGGENILFTRDSAVFLNGRELARDAGIENPILVHTGDKLHIMWKSGSFIRYMSCSDGETFGGARRFMSTGKTVNIYRAQKGEGFAEYYGYHNEHELVLLGNPALFEISAEYTAKKEAELERVKNLLDKTQQEVADAKKEIARLGRVIGSLTGRG